MKRFVAERLKRGWSSAELARQAGLNASTLCTIESGRLNPWPSQLEKLISALDWKGDPKALLEEVEEELTR